MASRGLHYDCLALTHSRLRSVLLLSRYSHTPTDHSCNLCLFPHTQAKFEDPNSAGFGAQAIAAAQAAEARQKAESDRQAKAAGRDVEDSKPAEGGLSEGELFGGASDDKKKESSTSDESEGEVDATGVDEQDIDTVMKQTSCSRAKAVKALKEHNGDIVNAIMAAS